MRHAPRTPAQKQLHADAVAYARAANAWTAAALRHTAAGAPVDAWDARTLASSYRQRLRLVLHASQNVTISDRMHA